MFFDSHAHYNDERFKDIQVKGLDKDLKELEKKYDTDLEEVIATERYEFIEKIKKDLEKEISKNIYQVQSQLNGFLSWLSL